MLGASDNTRVVATATNFEQKHTTTQTFLVSAQSVLSVTDATEKNILLVYMHSRSVVFLGLLQAWGFYKWR